MGVSPGWKRLCRAASTGMDDYNSANALATGGVGGCGITPLSSMSESDSRLQRTVVYTCLRTVTVYREPLGEVCGLFVDCGFKSGRVVVVVGFVFVDLHIELTSAEVQHFAFQRAQTAHFGRVCQKLASARVETIGENRSFGALDAING